MTATSKGSALWPVIVGMIGLLAGAAVLEAAGRSREQRGDVIVISATSEVGSDESSTEDAPLWSEPLDARHAKARRLVQRGQYAEATSVFLALLDAHSDAPELLAEFGYLQLIDGKSAAAESTLSLAREKAPNNAWLTLTLATASKRTGHVANAERMYLEALKIRPHYSAAKLALGRFLRQQGRESEALPWLQEISTRGSNEDRATALAELGRTYLKLGNIPDAEAAFDSAIGRAPASVIVRMAIARGYIESGTPESLEKATRSLQLAIQLAPAVAQLQSLLGATLIQRGDSVSGRAAFQKSLDLDPDYEYAHRRILRIDLNASDFSQARLHAQSLLLIDDKEPEYHFLSALIEARDKNWELARAGYTKAISLAQGNYPAAYMNLGKLERRLRNYDAAVANYRKAMELRPGYKEAWNNLALALLADGKNQEAISEFQSLTAAHPDYAEARLNLAKGYATMENYIAAIAELRNALKIRPDYASAQLNLASILRKSGNATEAVSVYDEIIEQQPRYVSAWYNRGIALEDSGRRSDARDSYVEALRLDKEHLVSLKRLARLELREKAYRKAEKLYTDILDRNPDDAKSRRLRGESRAGMRDQQGCLADAAIAKKQEPNNSNLERLYKICNNDDRYNNETLN